VRSRSSQLVRQFEDEFKNRGHLDVVDELLTDNFAHHLPYPGLPEGRAGMRAVGELVTGVFRDIHVSVSLILTDGDLVADRVEATGIRNDTGEAASRVENHIYRASNGRIAVLWPAGGPQL
jgi:predicted SnoaL-like aldol condensation-catalyzing enzyme